MAVFRFVALVLIVLGLMLLGADVVTMLEKGNEPHLRSLADIWGLFATDGATAFNTWATQSMPAPLPEGIATILMFPAFAVLGATGVLFAVLFREREEY
jgi:hypothetical protein